MQERFNLEIKPEQVDSCQLSKGSPVLLKEFLGFVEDNLCIYLDLGFDCPTGFSSYLDLEALAIDSGKLYFIVSDDEPIMNTGYLKFKEFTPHRLIQIGKKSTFPDLIKILESLDKDLTIGFAILSNDRLKISKANLVLIGLSVMSSLQTIWLHPRTISIFGMFEELKKFKYPLSFSKAKKELLKGKTIARQINDEEEILYHLDGEYIYESYRGVNALVRLSKTLLTSNYRLVD